MCWLSGLQLVLTPSVLLPWRDILLSKQGISLQQSFACLSWLNEYLRIACSAALFQRMCFKEIHDGRSKSAIVETTFISHRVRPLCSTSSNPM
jgi:hypothetical protein